MPNKYMEKFNELINKSNGERKINQLSREEIVANWWEQMRQRNGRGNYGLTEKMKEFNIDTLGELDRLLGYKSSGTISGYLRGNKETSYNTMNRVYSFFENELNIQPPKTQKTPRRNRDVKKSDEYNDLLNWYNDFDLKNWMDNTGLTKMELKNKTNLSEGSIHNLRYKKMTTPSITTLSRLKNFVDDYNNIINTNPVAQVMTFTSVPVEEVPEDIRKIGQELVREVNENITLKEKLVLKYEDEIEQINIMIEQHQLIIADLKRDKRVYEKVLEDLNED